LVSRLVTVWLPIHLLRVEPQSAPTKMASTQEPMSTTDSSKSRTFTVWLN